MSARFYVDLALLTGNVVSLPAHAARHVQVLRLQPGASITLFNARGEDEGEFEATVESMGRSDVVVSIGAYTVTRREAQRAVHLAIGMPANERMDWLIEKATELGAASIQPLMSERSVLRIKGERAEKKLAHWRGIAVAACEQCGRNRVPLIHEATTLSDWLKSSASETARATFGTRVLLSLQAETKALAQAVAGSGGGLQHVLAGPAVQHQRQPTPAA